MIDKVVYRCLVLQEYCVNENLKSYWVFLAVLTTGAMIVIAVGPSRGFYFESNQTVFSTGRTPIQQISNQFREDNSDEAHCLDLDRSSAEGVCLSIVIFVFSSPFRFIFRVTKSLPASGRVANKDIPNVLRSILSTMVCVIESGLPYPTSYGIRDDAMV